MNDDIGRRNVMKNKGMGENVWGRSDEEHEGEKIRRNTCSRRRRIKD